VLVPALVLLLGDRFWWPGLRRATTIGGGGSASATAGQR
jgi:RND superfamily putative drug exporter